MDRQSIMSVAGIRGMGRRARASVKALQEALPSHPDTVAAYVTGSHAHGTATERSDLDIYHIVRRDKWNQENYSIISDAVGDRIKVDVVVDSMKSFGKSVNMYGSFEYWATRDGIVIYEDGSADWRTVLDSIRDVCLPDCSERWLEFAMGCMNDADAYLQDGGRGNSFPCILYRRAISASLMAALTHDNVRFPFTKQLADMAGLLHDRSVVRGHRLDMTDQWVPSALDEYEPTTADMQTGARMARYIHRAVTEYCGA